mmetsp:Transcript_25346/g.50863  ORF Transcript_25346/g.50863 Transcript_25346/m.50863 type:complete len:201 (+) Transcript_25346:182-784(+)
MLLYGIIPLLWLLSAAAAASRASAFFSRFACRVAAATSKAAWTTFRARLSTNCDTSFCSSLNSEGLLVRSARMCRSSPLRFPKCSKGAGRCTKRSGGRLVFTGHAKWFVSRRATTTLDRHPQLSGHSGSAMPPLLLLLPPLLLAPPPSSSSSSEVVGGRQTLSWCSPGLPTKRTTSHSYHCQVSSFAGGASTSTRERVCT